MNRTRANACALPFAMLLVIGLCGCGPGLPASASGSNTSTAADQAEDLLSKAARAMHELKSYHFVEVSDMNTLYPVQSEGDFENPDKEHLQLRAEDRGKVEMIRVGDESYARFDEDTSFQQVPVQLLDGWMPGTRIMNDMRAVKEVRIVADERISDTDTTHVVFMYDGRSDKLPTPADVSGFEETQCSVWIEKSTAYVLKYEISFSRGGKTDTSVVFSNFDQQVSPPIQKPANIAEVPVLAPTHTRVP